MSIHIGAKDGEIANTVLVCGDPLRAEHIANTYLEEAICYSSVRNMLGFTGNYNGKRISVQGTGMGQPSLAIYLHELIHEYGAKRIIRVGTCGALNQDIELGDIIVAQGASTDSNMNKLIFSGLDFAPLPDYGLMSSAIKEAERQHIKVIVGNVFSTDYFYFKDDPERWKIWINHGILCAEMESSLLFTMAAAEGVRACSILTVSDNIILGKACTTEERESSFNDMMKIALNIC
ncbi:purine-nucleoside phosphorylase [Fulvivirga lutea]|uniref:Uridine phosphorylase n=1 Tax=Fulvivirga lutea TaxID=2810512 RepID=A0A974WKZ0_9BACT|nr:purine-nucleoside phosphorylase [Fulvivirga lutea]QSE98105.1 purine-nucleoside phosphorylase [Fulvivirga lutea]